MAGLVNRLAGAQALDNNWNVIVDCSNYGMCERSIEETTHRLK